MHVNFTKNPSNQQISKKIVHFTEKSLNILFSKLDWDAGLNYLLSYVCLPTSRPKSLLIYLRSTMTSSMETGTWQVPPTALIGALLPLACCKICWEKWKLWTDAKLHYERKMFGNYLNYVFIIFGENSRVNTRSIDLQKLS